MGFSCGIVGLPNVGKSTIFNALTSAKAASENFPFCTIEPNTGVVPVPDPRLSNLAKLASSAKTIPTQMTFVDIAGLIKGAASGEGLGNQFLSHIRSVDAIAHVVRCFEDENIIHVEGTVDPIRDIETIDTELGLADLDSVQKQATRVAKNAKSGNKEALNKVEALKQLEEHLGNGLPARTWESDLDKETIADVLSQLLTAKPVLFVANVEEDLAMLSLDEAVTKNSFLNKLNSYASDNSAEIVMISGKLEAELSELSADEKVEYLEELGLESPGLDRLILAGYKLLNLITFFTVGPKEAHAWTVIKDSSAPKCAGKIHTDFEKGFIRAEVIAYKDYAEAGSELKAKEAGKLRTEGKEYLCKDGDIMHFRFNV